MRNVGACDMYVCKPLSGRWVFGSQDEPWMRPFPPGLSVARTATPLTFVSIVGLRGATPVPELFAFWRCPLRLLDDLHALYSVGHVRVRSVSERLARVCWSSLVGPRWSRVGALVGGFTTSLAARGSTCHVLACVRVWSVVFLLRVDF